LLLGSLIKFQKKGIFRKKQMYKGKIFLKTLILITFIVHCSFAAWTSNDCMSDDSNCACTNHFCKHESSETAIGKVCDCDVKSQAQNKNETNFPIKDPNPSSIVPIHLFLPTYIIISKVSDTTEHFHINSYYPDIFSRAPPFSLV